MGLHCCMITKDATPNGEKPRNKVTLTASTSLWGILTVINVCKSKVKSNLGIMDGGIKMWNYF